MRNKKSRKPTNNEIKTVINGMLREIEFMRDYIQRLDNVMSSYIRMNNHEAQFKSYVLKLKEDYESKQKDAGKSSGGNRKAKVKDIESRTKDNASNTKRKEPLRAKEKKKV